MDFQTALGRYLSKEQREAIGKVKVGIAGAGGLGSNCAAYLVRSGFRKFRIVDFDWVEPSNLNRQFFFCDQVGMPKVEALAQNLRRIEPNLELELIQQRITAQNAGQLFAQEEAVIECVDLPEVKELLVQCYVPTGKLVITASGIAGWGRSDSIGVRQVRNNFYVVGDERSGIDTLPPLAPRVAVAAAKQADILLARILDQVIKEGK
jgi:sulfur carrier protein ThiS adenylyltransferase